MLPKGRPSHTPIMEARSFPEPCRTNMRDILLCSSRVVWDVCFLTWVASLELASLPSLSHNDHIEYVGPDHPMSLLEEPRFCHVRLLGLIHSPHLPRRVACSSALSAWSALAQVLVIDTDVFGYFSDSWIEFEKVPCMASVLRWYT